MTRRMPLVRCASLIVFLAVVVSTYAWTAAASDVQRISKEDLRSKLESGQVIVIDVRTKRDWDKSSFKIRGAVREDPADVASWSSKYPKDATIVLYCA